VIISARPELTLTTEKALVGPSTAGFRSAIVAETVMNGSSAPATLRRLLFLPTRLRSVVNTMVVRPLTSN